MEINVEAVIELIEENFRNNKTWFAETIGIDSSYVSQILHKKRSATSPKMCNAIIKYCNNNKIDYKKYIFL